MSKWKMVNFTDCFSDVTSKARKIPKEQYLEYGKFPIVDQGKSEIAGYSNFEEGLYSDVPAILFGDHTRIIKFINFPLFIGADGVKLLRCKKDNVDYKFLYYVLLSLKIVDTGYNRHFKWLKENFIPLPPLEEQKKIAQELDSIQSLIAKRKEQLEKMDLLVKAKFVEMFGDPVANPMGWEVKKCVETGTFKNGINFGKKEHGEHIHCLGVSDFKDLSKITEISNLSKVFLDKNPSKGYFLQDNDIIFVRSNGNKNLVGRCIAIYPDNLPVVFSGFCIRYRKLLKKLNTDFLLNMFKHPSTRKKLLGRGANIQNLNQEILGKLLIPLPPIDLQNQFTDYVQQTEKLKTTMHSGLEKLEILYNSKMQEYFG